MVTRPNKIMKQKPKELKQCENCKWFTENRSDNCNFCLNKNEFKPNELDWKKQIKPNDGVRYGFLTINGKYLNKKVLVDFIEKLLENQRKELLIL